MNSRERWKEIVEQSLDGLRFGSVELALRAHQLDLDDKSFPVYSDSTKSVSSATAYAGAVNWYATKNVRLTTEYSLTQFEGGAKKGDRLDEKLLTATANVTF